MSQEQKDPQNNKKNNFFNQNPLLVFAIFSIVVILGFKNFTGNNDMGGGAPASFGAMNTVSKNINYYELKELIKKGDFGIYGKDGDLVINFLSTNDITGGNSGSPVINGKGELIGIAFDGNWEAMSGDIAFENELQRTISVDIRYVLFVIDKYAGAKHLIDELTLVK